MLTKRSLFTMFAVVMVLVPAALTFAKSSKVTTPTNTVYMRPVGYDVTFSGSTLIAGDFWHMVWDLYGVRRLSFATGTVGYSQFQEINEAMTCPRSSNSTSATSASSYCEDHTLGECLKVTYNPVADVVLDIQKVPHSKENNCATGSTY